MCSLQKRLKNVSGKSATASGSPAWRGKSLLPCSKLSLQGLEEGEGSDLGGQAEYPNSGELMQIDSKQLFYMSQDIMGS